MRPLVIVSLLSLAMASTAGADTPVVLQPGRAYPAYGSPLTTDFNQDNRLDLIGVGNSADGIALLPNRGHGTFEFHAGPDMRFTGWSAHVANMNGDAFDDIVMRDGGSYGGSGPGPYDAATVDVMFGRPGGFDPPQAAAAAPEPIVDLVIGDFNGDSHVDVGELSKASRRIWLFSGDGAGHLGQGVSYAFGPDYAPGAYSVPSIATGDLDGDGTTDLVLGTTPCSVMLGHSSGGLSAPLRTQSVGCPSPVVGHVDADDRLDVVSGRTLLLGDGHGHFSVGPRLPAATGPSLSAIPPTLVEDVSGDHRPDLVAGAAENVYVATSRGGGRFNPFHAYWALPRGIGIGEGGFNVTPAFVADLNADGLKDLAVASDTGTEVFLAAHLKPGRCANPVDAGFIRTSGTTFGDRITVTTNHGRAYGGPGDDCLIGGRRSSVLEAGTGNDTLTGGPARDRLIGGRGNDVIHARDGGVDTVLCGAGRDTAYVDRVDRLTGCEHVLRGRAAG